MKSSGSGLIVCLPSLSTQKITGYDRQGQGVIGQGGGTEGNM